jgi:hypothetical protein
MGDEQGTAQADPVTVAVEAELARLIRHVEARAATRQYPLGGRRATIYAVMRTAVGIDRERWRLLAGVEPDMSEDPEERERLRAEQREQGERAEREREANLTLIEQYEPGYRNRECCAGCTAERAAMYRGRETAPVLPDMPEPEPEPPAPERTCECEYCTDEACQGDCNECDEHSCAQCNCGPDAAYACCGYCPECESHEGDGNNERCNMGHCHECNHRCDDY